jgi:hypothetical protein
MGVEATLDCGRWVPRCAQHPVVATGLNGADSVNALVLRQAWSEHLHGGAERHGGRSGSCVSAGASLGLGGARSAPGPGAGGGCVDVALAQSR